MTKSHYLLKIAPRSLGAFLCTLIAFTSGCERRSETPDWTPALEATPRQSPEPEAEKPAAKRRGRPTTGETSVTEAIGSLRFVSYNLHNWLTDQRPVNGALRQTSKPELSKQAVVTLLSGARPDVLGLCEIGSSDDLTELQIRLKNAGLDLPNSHYIGGSDPTRHLALLSRFPIIATGTPEKADYRLEGRPFVIQRGILDASIDVSGQTYRFLGAHLKSKRESENIDQSQMRQNEAHLLRDHIDSILKADTTSRLVVYGDLNDTKASAALKTLQGTFGRSDYLTTLNLKDSQGQSWTHYWEMEDIYSRLDWILVSRSLKPRINSTASRIIDASSWEKASDHRPILMVVE